MTERTHDIEIDLHDPARPTGAALRLTLSARPGGVTLVARRAETPAGLDWAAVMLAYADGALTIQLWGEFESLLEGDPPHTTETLIRAVDALSPTRRYYPVAPHGCRLPSACRSPRWVRHSDANLPLAVIGVYPDRCDAVSPHAMLSSNQRVASQASGARGWM
jgi:hypothetical protein